MILNINELLKEVGINVLEIFDILYYSDNMFLLLEELKKYNNYKFLPNDRIIFIHGEPEFIFNDLRFDLYNIQTAIHAAGIPNFACIIISQQDILQDLEFFKNSLTSEPISIGFIHAECILIHVINFDIDLTKYELNSSSIEKSFIFLSNNPRSNKIHMFNWLEYNNLLDKGIISFKGIDTNQTNLTNKNQEYNLKTNNVNFIQSTPYIRGNEKWIIKDQLLNKIFSKKPVSRYKNFTETSKTDFRYYNNNSSLIQRAFCYISNETTFNYPTFTTEKTFKSLPAMRPMISYGSAGCLEKIKDLGFKTWDRWWSEDYDKIKDPEKRFIEVSNLIKTVSEFSLDKCKSMLWEMLPTLEHNRDLYLKNFISYQIDLIKKQAIENINRKKYK